MNKIFKSLSQRDILILLKRIIITNIFFTAVILVLNLFFDFEEFHRRLSFDNILEYQITVIIVLSLLETLILSFIINRWFSSRRIKINSLNELLKAGENESVELKASLRWDYKEKRVNQELERVIIKTIAGFMNTEGGTLLIGATDEKELIGLTMDYNTLKKKNSDGFLLHLTQLLNNYLGKEYSVFWSSNIIHTNRVDVCRINVLPASRPAYVRYNNQEEFFIRVAVTTQPMQIKEAHEYIKIHWKI